ncbi:hypothetical protein KJ940_20285, partial [Myxococcota bacterium]|nr:hypothetical protein [Myxococcota bacterium]
LIRAARRLASAPQARPADLDELEAALARRAARSMAATLSDTPQETATQQLEIIPQTPKTPVLGRRRTGLTALQIAPPMLASLTTLLGAGLSCHLPALGGGLLLGGLILGFIFWWRAS